MLRRLVEFSLSQRAFMLFCSLLVAAAGAYAFMRIPIDAFPNIAQVQVKIILKAPGMTPAGGRDPGHQRRSKWSCSAFRAQPSCARRRNTPSPTSPWISRTAPTSTGRASRWRSAWQACAAICPRTFPAVSRRSRRRSPTCSCSPIEGGGLSLEERRTPARLDHPSGPAHHSRRRRRQFARRPWCARSRSSPDAPRSPPPGSSVADLIEAIAANNRNDGAGRLSEGEKALVVRSEGAIQTPRDLEQIVLKIGGGPGAAHRRRGDRQIGSLTRYGAVTQDGKGEAVEGLVLSLRGADASAIVKAVRERLEELKSEPAARRDGQCRSMTAPNSSSGAVGTVNKALLEATVLVVVLLLLFLGNLRAALVVAVTLPMAALMTFLS